VALVRDEALLARLDEAGSVQTRDGVGVGDGGAVFADEAEGLVVGEGGRGGVDVEMVRGEGALEGPKGTRKGREEEERVQKREISLSPNGHAQTEREKRVERLTHTTTSLQATQRINALPSRRPDDGAEAVASLRLALLRLGLDRRSLADADGRARSTAAAVAEGEAGGADAAVLGGGEVLVGQEAAVLFERRKVQRVSDKKRSQQRRWSRMS
jgi:hypothetical protein